jgi:integrase/recombinase XerC/integrase/recombinase XerD
LNRSGVTEEEIDHKTVRGFLAELSRAGHSVSTINRMLSALRSYFEYQVKYEKRSDNPFSRIRSLKKEDYLPDFFFEKEIGALIDLPSDDFLGTRDRLILELLYSTGCRVQELVSIDIKDVGFKERSIRIVGKGRKERMVFIGAKAFSALEAYMRIREQYIDTRDPDATNALFLNNRGRRITVRGVFYIIRKYSATLALPKKISPHTFRHTFATHILDHGADIRVVQELLGHASLSTTQVYTHLGIERLKKIYEQAHPHAKGHIPAQRREDNEL